MVKGDIARARTSNPGDIVLYTSDSRNGIIFTSSEFSRVAAHEFGHALGIADGAGFSAFPVMSIMNESVWDIPGSGASRLDLEMALRAHRTNTWQRWSNNFDLYRAHGVRR